MIDLDNLFKFTHKHKENLKVLSNETNKEPKRKLKLYNLIEQIYDIGHTDPYSIKCNDYILKIKSNQIIFKNSDYNLTIFHDLSNKSFDVYLSLKDLSKIIEIKCDADHIISARLWNYTADIIIKTLADIKALFNELFNKEQEQIEILNQIYED